MTTPAAVKFVVQVVPTCQFEGYQIALIAPEGDEHVQVSVNHFLDWYKEYVTRFLTATHVPSNPTCGWCGGQGYVEGSMNMRPYRIPCFRCKKRL